MSYKDTHNLVIDAFGPSMCRDCRRSGSELVAFKCEPVASSAVQPPNTDTLDELKEQIRKALGMCNDKSCTAKCVPQLKKAMALFTEHSKEVDRLARIDELHLLKQQEKYPFYSDEAEEYTIDRLAQLKSNKGENNA